MRSFTIILLAQFFVQSLTAQLDHSTLEKGLEQLVAQHNNVAVVAGYSIDGETKWLSAEGEADREKQIPFETSTVTRIASIAKPMTAVAIMQLVESGNLQLDDPIQKYIPEFPNKKKNAITIRHLLSHTSGIDGYKNSKEAMSKTQYPDLSDAMGIFMDRKLKFEPGSDFYYTSYGYLVLGVIIEIASGIEYEQYMHENIFDKLGMDNTEIEHLDDDHQNKSQAYHLLKGKAEVGARINLSNRIPAGGFHSTVEDLLKFGNAILNHSLITEESYNEMTQISFKIDEGNPYGLGWSLYGKVGTENKLIGHDGDQIGANTQLLIHPRTKSVIVVLSNTAETGSNIILYAVDILKEIIASVDKN